MTTISFESLESLKDENAIVLSEEQKAAVAELEASIESTKAKIAEIVESKSKLDEADMDALALQIQSADNVLITTFEKMEQIEEISSIRESLLKVELEDDKSLLNHYSEALAQVGIDVTNTKVAAEQIATLIEKVEKKEFDEAVATLELDKTEVSEEVFFIAVAIAIYLAAIAYLVVVLNSIEARASKIKEIVGKGLRDQPKNTDKKMMLVTSKAYMDVMGSSKEALKSMFDNLEEFDNDAAKKVTDLMKKAGFVWNGKKYVLSDFGWISKMTLERAGWNKAAIVGASKVTTELVQVMIEAKSIEKKLKEAAKKVSKEDEEGSKDKAKEIKANRKLAGKTLRTIGSYANDYTKILLTVAKQYEM